MKNHTNVWRLTQTGLAIVLVFVLLNTWLGRQYQAQLLLAQQADEQIMLLTDHTISTVTPLLKFNHTDELQQLTQRLVADPRFISASIFSDKGERLAFAQRIYLGTEPFSDAELQQALTRYPVTTEFVQHGEQRLGFIRFRIDRDQFFTAIAEQHHEQQQQMLLMLLIAGLCGALLARSLSFKRARYKKQLLAKYNLAMAQNKLAQLTELRSEPSAPSTAQELTPRAFHMANNRPVPQEEQQANTDQKT